MSPLKSWSTILNQLETILSPATVKTWFYKTEAEYDGEATIEIVFPNVFSLQRVNAHYQTSLKQVLETQLNRSNLLLKLSLKPALNQPLGPLFSNLEEIKPAIKEGLELVSSTGITPSPTPAVADENLKPKGWQPPTATLKTVAFGLSPFFTLADFVVGPGNQLAYSVALSVAQNPGKAYNPFFIYASTGLGKTHLMQAIGNEIINRFPQTKVVYSSGETFTNELLEAIQHRSQKRFREKFRQTDVLLIDDVQFVAGKEVTQEELFHAFNDLYLSQKQIILTSDRPPRDIPLLEERLRSRFSGGMIADMSAPDETVRTAILRTKRDRGGFDVENGVIDFVASAVKTNIREMEGVFLQIVSTAKARNVAADLNLASEILAQNKLLNQQEKPTPKKIMEEVGLFFNLSHKDLVGQSRIKELVVPRQICMFLLRTLTQMSLAGIGQTLGNRDHTTIMHGLTKMEALIKEDKEFSQKVSFLTVRICG